jgi:hypothetical protein
MGQTQQGVEAPSLSGNKFNGKQRGNETPNQKSA